MCISYWVKISVRWYECTNLKCKFWYFNKYLHLNNFHPNQDNYFHHPGKFLMSIPTTWKPLLLNFYHYRLVLSVLLKCVDIYLLCYVQWDFYWWKMFHFVNIPQFSIHSSDSWTLWIIGSINIFEQSFFGNLFLYFFWDYVGVKLINHRVVVANIRNYKTVFQSVWKLILLVIYKSSSCSINQPSVVRLLPMCMDECQYVIAGLMCLFLMINDIEHIFV